MWDVHFGSWTLIVNDCTACNRSVHNIAYTETNPIAFISHIIGAGLAPLAGVRC